MRQLTKGAAGLALALSLALTLTPGALAAEEAPERGVLAYSRFLTPRYEDASPFSEGLAAVRENGKWGYIDETGSLVISCQYDLAYPFREGLAIVAVGNPVTEGDTCTVGFIDREGTFTPFQVTGPGGQDPSPMVVDPDLLPDTNSLFFHNGYALLDLGTGTNALYGTDGKPLSGELTPTGPMNQGLIPGYSTQGYVGYMDTQGHTVKLWDSFAFFGPQSTDETGTLRQDYRYISNVITFNQGLAPVWQATMDVETGQESYKLGFLDSSYRWVIQPQFTGYYYSGVGSTYQLFGETGLAMVEKDGKYGAVNKAGETVLPFQYEELWPMSEGLILFRQWGKYGYLDETGQVVIPAQYEQATGFNLGMAVVYDGAKAFLIDRSGQEVPGADELDPSVYFTVGPDGTQVTYQPEEYVVIQEDGKYGYGRIQYLPPLPAQSDMDAWAYEEVTAAIEANLVPVHLQNLYRNNITREEFCDLTIQALVETLGQDIGEIVAGRTGKDLYRWIGEYPFKDTSNANVIAAYALGIVSGRGNGVFDPYAAITRQEAAAFLMRSAKALGMDTGSADSASFADQNMVGEWFTDAVAFVYHNGIMSGTGGNCFSPLAPYTREQSYVTIYRLFQGI